MLEAGSQRQLAYMRDFCSILYLCCIRGADAPMDPMQVHWFQASDLSVGDRSLLSHVYRLQLCSTQSSAQIIRSYTSMLELSRVCMDDDAVD